MKLFASNTHVRAASLRLYTKGIFSITCVSLSHVMFIHLLIYFNRDLLKELSRKLKQCWTVLVEAKFSSIKSRLIAKK